MFLPFDNKSQHDELVAEIKLLDPIKDHDLILILRLIMDPTRNRES